MITKDGFVRLKDLQIFEIVITVLSFDLIIKQVGGGKIESI